MSTWAWTCSEDDCDFAEEQPQGEAAVAALLQRWVEHEDAHPGHLAVVSRMSPA